MEDMNITTSNTTNEVGTAEVRKSKEFERDFAPHRRVSIRICKRCGRTYTLSDSDAVHYIQNYGQLPLRCEECRAKNRTHTTVFIENLEVSE